MDTETLEALSSQRPEHQEERYRQLAIILCGKRLTGVNGGRDWIELRFEDGAKLEVYAADIEWFLSGEGEE